MIAFTERATCPLCGSSGGTVLLERSYSSSEMRSYVHKFYNGRALVSEGRYTLLECHCGGVWQKYILNNEGMAALYGSWIDSEMSFKKKTAGDWDLYRRYAREVEFIERLFPEKMPSAIRVLDFGAGWGVWLRMAQAYNLKCMGIEIAEDRVQYARSFGVTLAPQLGALKKTPQFDFINAEQVFEHVADPSAEINALVAVLKPGGVMRVAVPEGARDIQRARKGMWEPAKGATQPLEHINTFTPKTLSAFLARHGLVYMEDGSAAFRGFAATLRSYASTMRGAHTTAQYVRKV